MEGDPVVGGGGVGGEKFEVFSGNVESELYGGAAEGVEGGVGRGVEAHAGDVVVLEEGDDLGGRREVVAEHSVAYADVGVCRKLVRERVENVTRDMDFAPRNESKN